MKKCIIISCITLLFLFTFSGALAEKQQIALTKKNYKLLSMKLESLMSLPY